MQRFICASALALALGVSSTATAAVSTSVELDELTWTELRDRQLAGTTTVLVPIGGTEQSGPHMALGKHNRRAHVIANRIAVRLGNAVVAPTLAYVPEGSISPPAAHMRFTGTISIPEAVFEAVIESTARSFRQHGFRTVVFLGDHGGYQQNLARVAAKLQREWATKPGCKVVALLDYYRVTQTDFVEALKTRGFGIDEIGSHAGLSDTSLMLAIEPAMVRGEALALAARAGAKEGVHGDPRRATAELGQIGIERVVERSAQMIREATAAR